MSADYESAAELVTLLRDVALQVSREAVRPPNRIRVAAYDVVVEMGWSDGAEPAPVTGTVAPAAPDAGETTVDDGAIALPAGLVGVFYRAPEPTAQPFVAEGDVVRAGQQVGLIEAMKLLVPVEADRAGRVVRILVEDGKPVEYGQPLMLVDPGGAA